MGSFKVRSVALLAALSLTVTACAAQAPAPEGVPAPVAEVTAPEKVEKPKAEPAKKDAPAKAAPRQFAWPTPTPATASDDEELGVEGEETVIFKTAKRAGGVDCSVDKCVALTYDDGPGPHTEKLLKHLKDGGAKATFFMVGQMANARPGVVKKVAAQGHQIANHTWAHKNLRQQSQQPEDGGQHHRQEAA